QHKNTLGRVDANADNLAHGRLLLSEETNHQRPHSGTAMPLGAVHPNSSHRGSFARHAKTGAADHAHKAVRCLLDSGSRAEEALGRNDDPRVTDSIRSFRRLRATNSGRVMSTPVRVALHFDDAKIIP